MKMKHVVTASILVSALAGLAVYFAVYRASDDGAGRPGVRSLVLGTTPQIATGAGPLAVTTGDFNGDRRLELAVASYDIANEDRNYISVLLNLGCLP